MTALATATQAMKLAQELRGIDKAVDAAEYKLKIADLTSALSDIKLALTDAREEIASKDAEIERLRRQFKRSSDTTEVNGYHYDKKSDGSPTGHPYCPVCLEKSGLMFHTTPSRIGRYETCPNCKADFLPQTF